MPSTKRFLLDAAPGFLLQPIGRIKRAIEGWRNQGKSTEEVFTEIYEQNKWNKWDDSGGQFDSGAGTSDDVIASAYVRMLTGKAAAEGFKGLRFVDLGCGDFRIGRQLLPLCSHYTGVDIVKSLVQHNQDRFGNESTVFRQINVIEEPLPDGDVCFIRQVLQHLSNQQICVVLGKLKQYRWVFITEHYPTDNQQIVPNVDKAHGSGIRLFNNSGVYLTESPFSLPRDKIELVLEVGGHPFRDKSDPGVIRTFLYKPNG
jgi:SAM-dependent methyltransferase